MELTDLLEQAGKEMNFLTREGLLQRCGRAIKNFFLHGEDNAPTVDRSSTPEQQPESPPVLDLQDQNAWDDLMQRVCNVGTLRAFPVKYGKKFAWFESTLGRLDKEVSKHTAKTPTVFEPETTEKTAFAVVAIAETLMPTLQTCADQLRLNPGDAAYSELKKLIEKYLLGIGITQKHFEKGDNYEDWANLEMKNDATAQETTDWQQRNKLCRVDVQPHVLRYRNAFGEDEQIFFGGSCVVYSYKKQ